MERGRILHVLRLGRRLPAGWPGSGRADAVDGGRAAPGPDRAAWLPRRPGFLRPHGAPACSRCWAACVRPAAATAGATGWSTCAGALRRRMVQAVALALGLTALLLLTVARGDLLDSWLKRVPADAPNRFAINIQPDQRVAIADFFKARSLPRRNWSRWCAAGWFRSIHSPVGPESFVDDRAQRLVDREFNLSWSAQRCLPATPISGGRWHGATQAAEFSVEQGLAETLNLRLGDRLTYEIAGNRVEAIDHQPAQARLGFDARQFFRHVAAGGAPTIRPASSPVSTCRRTRRA
jgi:hypothetical protein